MIPIAKPYLDDKEISAVTEVIKSGILAQGPKVKQLEENFAKFCGTKYAVAVNSGTAALHTALYSAGIVPGDEVITTPFTFIATANTILMVGAKPVFVDVKEDTFNISPDKIREKITDKTKAIVTVDLFGQLSDYDEIEKIAEKNNIKIIEDACQAIDAEYKGRKAGNYGDMSCFSLYATKNIISGEGGIITTNNLEFAEKAKLFRQHGRSNMVGYDYNNIGYNYRMMDLSAAIALEQLKKLEFITNRRIENARLLSEGLKNINGLTLPKIKENHKHVFHQYTIVVGEEFPMTREELKEHLIREGIGCGVYYPKPLHLVEIYKKIGYKEGDFPVSEKLSKQVLSLPIHPHLTNEELSKIIKVFKEIK